jgi:hypothetical protein
MKYKSWYLVLFISLLVACKKAAPKEEEPQEPKLTKEILTLSGTSQRVWGLFIMEIKYISASGAVDSTYTKGPIFNLATDRHEIRFSIDKDVRTGSNDEKTYNLYTPQDVLKKVFPGFGNWVLSMDGKKLLCGKYTPMPSLSLGGDGGLFDVEYTDVTFPPFPLSKALGLKITQPLPNNRKAEASFIFAGI